MRFGKIMFYKSIIVLFMCIVTEFYLYEYHVSAINNLRKTLPLLDSAIMHLHVNIQRIFKLNDTPPQIREGDRSDEERLFTADELKKFSDEESGLYLAILGKVYDVSEGTKYYGREGGYRVFTGRDASRAFVTGDFTENGLTDNVIDLSVEELRSLSTWAKIYDKKYIYKGKLVGRYYDDVGKPTDYTIALEEKIELSKQQEDVDAQQKLRFPPCNMEWSPETGSRVWCTKLSGGIKRDWAGVPRKLYEPGSETFRCACVNMESTSLHEKGNMREYFDCHQKATSCNVYEEPRTGIQE